MILVTTYRKNHLLTIYLRNLKSTIEKRQKRHVQEPI